MLGFGVLMGRGRSRRQQTCTSQGVCLLALSMERPWQRGPLRSDEHIQGPNATPPAKESRLLRTRRVPGLRQGDPTTSVVPESENCSTADENTSQMQEAPRVTTSSRVWNDRASQ